MVLMLAGAMVVGCAQTQTAAVSEQFFAAPGHYSAAPLSAARPRVGVPAPAVEVVEGAAADDRPGADAADQLFWVADQSGRFNLIERVRLAEIITQQGQSGIIRPGELARTGRLKGVDYLLVCRISGLSIRGADHPATVSVANLERIIKVSEPMPRITTTCQVQMRLIDPATGAAGATAEDSFQRVCSPGAMGLSFSTPDAPWGELHLNDEQLNQVLRVVLDDAMRRMLPEADALLTRPALVSPADSAAASSATGPSGGTAAGTKPAIAKIYCPTCGFECSPDDEFCPNCGTRLLLNGVRVKPAGK